jgi:predicted component of type VI protein secretion system
MRALRLTLVAMGTAVVALPLALGRGRLADNPSALPRDYVGGLLTILALVWLAVAVTLVVRSIRARRASRVTRTSAGGGRKDSATDHPVPPP